jgi:hypothetical protein
MKTKPKKKTSALAAAASRRLSAIGESKMSPQDVAHSLFHAEERGDVERVTMDDGSWAWAMKPGPDGQRQILKPTPEMLAHLEDLARGIGHNH